MPCRIPDVRSSFWNNQSWKLCDFHTRREPRIEDANFSNLSWTRFFTDHKLGEIHWRGRSLSGCDNLSRHFSTGLWGIFLQSLGSRVSFFEILDIRLPLIFGPPFFDLSFWELNGANLTIDLERKSDLLWIRIMESFPPRLTGSNLSGEVAKLLGICHSKPQ